MNFIDTKLVSPEDLSEVTKALKHDEIVAIPTETVYGLAGNALSSKAVLKIFQAKERPQFDPLIVHIADLSQLHQIIDFQHPSFNETHKNQIQLLTQKFWIQSPSPLTLLLPKTNIIPDLVTSGLSRVAVRMPSHPVAKKIIQLAGVPLAAPSANRFGRISPTCANHVFEELNGRIPFIVNGGSCEIGVESTIIGLSESGNWEVYRQGGLPLNAIENLLEEKISITNSHLDSIHTKKSLLAPGTLTSHYAPLATLKLFQSVREIESLNHELQLSSVGILWWNKSLKKELTIPLNKQLTLSENNDIIEIAQNLFSYLRELDKTCRIIFAQTPLNPNLNTLEGAILDRLARAQSKF